MTIQLHHGNDPAFPAAVRALAQKPEQLYIEGPLLELLRMPRVAVVGSRYPSPYGRHTTTRFARELAGQGCVILSGLALGIDALAHRAALDAGGRSVAVLPAGLGHIYPATNQLLARRILEQKGALLSEYGPDVTAPHKHNFIARNRLIAALADAVLITEAAERSGSLHTAAFALELGIPVLAVPGNIDSVVSVGANNLLKDGALPVTHVNDVLHAVGLPAIGSSRSKPTGTTAAEQTVLELAHSGTREGDKLMELSGLNASEFNQTLTMLEIRGLLRPLGANQWSPP